MNQNHSLCLVLLVCGMCLIILGVSLIIPITGTKSKDDSGTIINIDGPGPTNHNSRHWSSVGMHSALAYDIASFRYYNVSDGKLISPGSNNRTVPWNRTIGFSFSVTNLHPNKQNITLEPICNMWSLYPSVPGETPGPTWNITNVDPKTGVISPIYAAITLPYNVTKELFFCRQSSKPTWSSLQRNKFVAVNLLMVGSLDGIFPENYAECIPFVSIYAKG